MIKKWIRAELEIVKKLKSKKFIVVLEIIALWATFALYIWIGSYDIRFYNVTRYVKYFLLIISIIYTIYSFYLLKKYFIKLKNYSDNN